MANVFICIIGISIARTMSKTKPPIRIITTGSSSDKNVDLLFSISDFIK
jgi:hypothetical protein